MDNIKETVILQRKQPREYTVNYPSETGIVTYKFLATRGGKISEREIPRAVYEWLLNSTQCLHNGDLIVKECEYEDEDIKYNRDFIENLEDIESTTLTRPEIEKILTEGNHNTLKKKLKEISNDKNEKVLGNLKNELKMVAIEIGIDSSAKRKAICEWIGVDFEKYGETLFEKEEV